MDEIIAAPANNLNPPGDGEYWDPVSDTYRSKKTNDRVPDEIVQEENTPGEHEIDSSLEISAALGSNPDSWECWDPISDSYKSKRPGKNTPKNEERRRISKSSPDPNLETVEDPAAGFWEYWDPISDSYKSKKSSKNTSDKDEEGGISKATPDSNPGDSIEDPAAGRWEYWDPVSDSYKSKKPGRNIPDKGEERGISKPSPDSTLGRSKDPAVERWEYWDPRSDSYVSKKPSRSTSDRNNNIRDPKSGSGSNPGKQ